MKVTLKQLADVQKDILTLTKLIAGIPKTPENKEILKTYRTALRGAKATKKYMEEQI